VEGGDHDGGLADGAHGVRALEGGEVLQEEGELDACGGHRVGERGDVDSLEDGHTLDEAEFEDGAAELEGGHEEEDDRAHCCGELGGQLET